MSQRNHFFWRARVALSAALIVFFTMSPAFAGRRKQKCRSTCPPPKCCAPVVSDNCSSCCEPAMGQPMLEEHGEHNHEHAPADSGGKPSVLTPIPAEPVDDAAAPLAPTPPAIDNAPANELADPDVAPPLPPADVVEPADDPAPAIEDAPAIDEPPAIDDGDAADAAPAIDEPPADEPAIDEPAIDEPAIDEPAADEPAPIDDPFGAPAADDDAAADPPAANPAINDPFALPPADEPAPDALDPADDVPADDVPVDDAPAADEDPAAEPAAPGNDPFGARIQESAPSLRIWTDATGKHRVTAQLFERLDGKVRLLKTNGRFSTVPMSRLSVADREYLAETAISARDWIKVAGR